MSRAANFACELPYELPNDFRLRILGNKEMLGNCEIWVETQLKFGCRQNLACSAAGLIALCQLRNFPCEFTEKCFVVLTNQVT